MTNIHISRAPGAVAILELPPHLDTTNATELRQQLNQLITDGRHHLIANMTKVTSIDPEPLAILIGAHARAQACGGELALASPNTALRHVLARSGLQRAAQITVYDTLKDALARRNATEIAPPASTAPTPQDTPAPDAAPEPCTDTHCPLHHTELPHEHQPKEDGVHAVPTQKTTPRRIRIENRNPEGKKILSGGRIIADGEDISHHVLSVDIHMDAKSVPTAHLEMLDLDVELEAVEADTASPAQPVESLTGQIIQCVPCTIEQHAGHRAEPNPAIIIAKGDAICREHLQINTQPVLPGRTAGGIILGNGS